MTIMVIMAVTVGGDRDDNDGDNVGDSDDDRDDGDVQ